MYTRTAEGDLAELRRIAAANDSRLTPQAVVEAARPVASYFHSEFQWDDAIAGENWRIRTARQLIARVTIVIPTRDNINVRVRGYVNLTSDRYDEPQYRETRVVLADPILRAQLIQDALADMRRFETKYSELKELADIFSAMRRFKDRNQ